MANDPTNTAPNVSVDGSIGWTGDAVPIQHPAPGQVIAPSPTPAPVPASTSAPVAPVKKTIPVVDLSSPSSGSYGVVHGDTLESIAVAHNTSVEQLKSLNPKLQTQSAIYPGQLLNLTQAATPAAVQAGATPAPEHPSIGPSQSTYTMANTHELEAAIHKELAGWAGPNASTDPVKNMIEAAQKPKTDTNPLRLEHDQK